MYTYIKVYWGYLHRALKRDNDRRGDLSYPNVVLYLMRQGLHLENKTFRCPVYLPQSKRWFSFQIHHIRPQNWSTELICSLCVRNCPEAASVLFPLQQQDDNPRLGHLLHETNHTSYGRESEVSSTDFTNGSGLCEHLGGNLCHEDRVSCLALWGLTLLSLHRQNVAGPLSQGGTG